MSVLHKLARSNYLDDRAPKHSAVKDGVQAEPNDVQADEVKVETNNTVTMTQIWFN